MVGVCRCRRRPPPEAEPLRVRPLVPIVAVLSLSLLVAHPVASELPPQRAAVTVHGAAARAAPTASDVAALHARHGHAQYQHGRGTPGHTWRAYQREARQLRHYLAVLALRPLLACSLDPHCAVRLASFFTAAPYGLVDRVVSCESGYNPNARNPSSSAGGLGQWLESSWASHAPQWGMSGHSRFEVWPAAFVTSGVIATGGIGNWAASRGCWS